ncbi:hypothetical protein L1987_42100 [Smallanthus sonchifolius]|uniref:Uncharacterized protein n=1 Tax=Smallanthus sonchifolius TaxID=185202 RepID=A0ACB9GX58_9ASTR|nr:hypothetical protein L1987_42100 [Smallanthus sonchifolius]
MEESSSDDIRTPLIQGIYNDEEENSPIKQVALPYLPPTMRHFQFSPSECGSWGHFPASSCLFSTSSSGTVLSLLASPPSPLRSPSSHSVNSWPPKSPIGCSLKDHVGSSL